MSNSAACCCNSVKRLASTRRKLAAHFVAQLGIALGLGGLTLQRVHLPRHFVEDVVDARQVLLGVGQAGFGEALASLEFGDAGGLFDDVAPVGGLAAQDLPDASLLDQRVRLRPSPVPMKMSWMSRRRQSLPLSWYSLSPERNSRRVTTISPFP